VKSIGSRVGVMNLYGTWPISRMYIHELNW